jgi:RNase P subunit RPR2
MMQLTGERRTIAAQMAEDNEVDTSCSRCSSELVPREARVALRGKAQVLMKCDNDHRRRFWISSDEAKRLDLLWKRDRPEMTG